MTTTRLVADRPAGLGSHKIIRAPWWSKFVFDTFDNYRSDDSGFWDGYHFSDQNKVLKKRLKEEFDGFLIETHFGCVIEFDSEAKATFFLLRWS